MSTIEDKPFELICPNPKCKKELGLKYYDVINREKARCPRCGSEINFHHSAISDLKSAISDYEKVQQKISIAKSRIMTNAEIKIKT